MLKSLASQEQNLAVQLENLHLAFVTMTRLTACAIYGHDIVDCSYGGPDHGNMDHCCRRCGAYWSVPLY